MNKLLTIFVVLFGIQGIFAADPAPPPPTPPPPPGLPIDGGIVVLFVMAIIFGYYLSNKYLSIKRLFIRAFFYFLNSFNRLTYLPITSNSKLTVVPILNVLKLVCSYV